MTTLQTLMPHQGATIKLLFQTQLVQNMKQKTASSFTPSTSTTEDVSLYFFIQGFVEVKFPICPIIKF